MKYRIFLAPQGAGVSKDGFEQIPSVLLDYLVDAEVVLPNNNASKTNNNNLKNLDKVIDYTFKLANKTAEAIKDDALPITIGGDHSIALGSILGVSSQINNLGVIWIDAHADMNTDETSPSGNLHGMPLSALQGIGSPLLIKHLPSEHFIKSENIVIIGVRSIDPLELELMLEKNIKFYTSEDIEIKGLKQVILEAKEYLENKVEYIHLSFDLDVMDPISYPGVSTPVAGGFDMFDAFDVVGYFIMKMNVVSMDIVEFNPSFDPDYTTRDLTINLAQYVKLAFKAKKET